MTNTLSQLRRGAIVLALVVTAGLAVAKGVPGDGAIPVVELMPLIMKHESDLKLSAEQIKSLEDYRKQAMPGRVAVQRKVIAQRGELRAAILDNKPQAEREALMNQISAAEIEHFQGRSRCVDHVRQTLSAAQFAQLTKLYSDGLR